MRNLIDVSDIIGAALSSSDSFGYLMLNHSSGFATDGLLIVNDRLNVSHWDRT